MASSNLTMPSADTGSNYKFGDKMKKANAPRSAFDLTHLSTFDIANAGIVYPVCKPIETLPGDSFDISVTSLIRYLPQTVPLYSRQRMYIYAFYSRMGDLWENFDTFMKKGLNGNKILNLPKLHVRTGEKANETNIDATSTKKYITTGSLGDMLGLPIGLDIYDDAESDGYNDAINALKFMMYTRIWRDYFCNPNLFLSMSDYNECIYPDNDDEFRLNDEGQIISFAKKNKTFKWNITAAGTNNGTNGNPKYGIHFGTTEKDDAAMNMGLFFQNWADDRFTDALPFPQRGNTPELTLEATIDKLMNDFDVTGEPSYLQLKRMKYILGQESPENIVLNEITLQRPNYDGQSQAMNNGRAFWALWNSQGSPDVPITSNVFEDDTKLKINSVENGGLVGTLKKDTYDFMDKMLKKDISIQTSITTNKLRELVIEQNELEKMALTDGSYKQFIQTFFGTTPKNAKNYHPVFIGGTYTDIHFTEVLQTGTNTAQNPLGEYGGHGIGGTDKEYLGHIECDDYGYIMILMCIAPDTYYCQGLDKGDVKTLQSEMFLPERARLGMVPVLNEELYALGDMEDNKGLFGYNMPFDEFRYRANEIHGQIADPTKTSFAPYTQARIFEDTPALNYEFDQMQSNPEDIASSQPSGGVRKDYLAAQIESMATAQFKIGLRAVRPLTYKASPAEIIN